MATTNTTRVNFVKVPTMAKFNDITTKADGTIYFIVDEKKIHLDGVMYGFNQNDIAGQFLELDGVGQVVNGSITVPEIEGLNHIAFNTDSAIVAQGGGLNFKTHGGTYNLIILNADGSMVFGADTISGIPEPTVDSSPISKEYLETNVINKIGADNGIATLDDGGKVPSTQLPSYVDDVVEYSDKASFPANGESGKLYIDLSNNKVWRWGGSEYHNVSDGNAHLVLGTTSSTAYRGDRGKTAYDHSQLTGTNDNPHAITKENVGLGNVENYGIATKGEAESGSGNKYMTPERTAQAIDAIAPKLNWTVVA